jgi:hypothetical protein
MYSLLDHHRKEKQRSTLWQKNILLNILLGIFGIYPVPDSYWELVFQQRQYSQKFMVVML